MAAQGAPPTPPQMDTIRAHPDVGVKMLEAAGITDTAWLAAVADHHERADGSGYPQGLREVGELPAVLRYVDVFMAKMAPRARRRPSSRSSASIRRASSCS
jgi:HD-GYP domain-containing protein (c-di-GMP phosphodiesterase class II)